MTDMLSSKLILYCLHAGSVAKTEMEDLRKALPSISNVLRNLHTNPGNYKLSTLLKSAYLPSICTYLINSPHIAGDQLERLLIVESEFGTLPGFTPALDTVTEFLTTVRCTLGAQSVVILHCKHL